MDIQPGQVITPHEEGSQSSVQASPDSPEAITSDKTGASPEITPSPISSSELVSSPTNTIPVTPANTPTADGDGSQFKSQESIPEQRLPIPDEIQWTAAEFIEHPKSTRWYGLLMLIGVVIAAGEYIFTKDVFSAVIIVMAVVVFCFYAARKPRAQEYHLRAQGLEVGARMYNFQSYKNFSVLNEGDMSSIVFIPLKHFEMPLTIYVPSEMEARVLDYLSNFLPLDQHRSDPLDSLLRRIGF